MRRRSPRPRPRPCRRAWARGSIPASSPRCLTEIPSAIVSPGRQTTPTIRCPGRRSRSASEMPAASPPPPTGIRTVSASGACSASSSPIVPWPAITRASSNAWTSVAPVRSTCACAAATAASKLSPPSSTAPPYDVVASTFAIGASSGMKIVARVFASRAAQATAWPWFPALAATTPASRSSGESEEMVL